MMLGKTFMKIGRTVGKIQALKCFKITVMGAAILIWKSHKLLSCEVMTSLLTTSHVDLYQGGH